MRKHCNRRVTNARPPMIAVLHLIKELSITERLSVEAFSGGYAGTDHYDNLADCRDMIALAAKGDDQAEAIAELAYVALANIRDRQAKTGKFGATGDELQALRALADFSEDFWKRKAGTVFEATYIALRLERTGQKAR